MIVTEVIIRQAIEASKRAYKQGYKDATDRAVEWLYRRQAEDLAVPNIEKFIEDFKEAMHGEAC